MLAWRRTLSPIQRCRAGVARTDAGTDPVPTGRISLRSTFVHGGAEFTQCHGEYGAWESKRLRLPAGKSQAEAIGEDQGRITRLEDGRTNLRAEEPALPIGSASVAHGPSPYLDQPADTDALGRVFRRLQELALSPAESKPHSKKQ